MGGATDFDDSGNVDVDISGISFAAGDIAIAAVSSNQFDDNVAMTGMTELYNSGDLSPADVQGLVFTKTLIGDETVLTTVNGASLRAATIVVGIFRGFSEPTVYDSADGTTGDPNPPALTSPVSAGDWVIATGHVGDNATACSLSDADYTLVGTVGRHSAAGWDSSTIMSYRTDPSGNENPDAFFRASTNLEWAAATIVLSPV